MKKFYVIIFLIFLLVTNLFGNELSKNLAITLANYGINPYLVVFIISAIPIVELRGAIPVGILLFKLDWTLVILISIIGNMLPIFFVLFLFEYIEKLLRNISIFNKFFDWLFKRTLAKSKEIEDYQEFGLALFVGIPLPATGAWTGSLIAYLLKLSYWKSILFIFLGVLLAAIIVSVLTFLKLIGLFIAILLLTIVTIAGIIKARRDHNKN